MAMKRLWAALAAALFSLAGAAQGVATLGEVVKIDSAAARVTLKHGEIKSLNMPPLTMAYRVKDPRQIEGLNVGDRVRFSAERIEGQYTVTALAKLP